MKLNPDCIRDVMLTLEEELSIKLDGPEWNRKFCFQPMRIERLVKMVQDKAWYEAIDIIYSAVQLKEDGYIIALEDPSVRDRSNIIALNEIVSITPKGHTFIASVYHQDNWKKIKPILGKVGSISLSVIETVSKGITTAAIEKLLVSLKQN